MTTKTSQLRKLNETHQVNGANAHFKCTSFIWSLLELTVKLWSNPILVIVFKELMKVAAACVLLCDVFWSATWSPFHLYPVCCMPKRTTVLIHVKGMKLLRGHTMSKHGLHQKDVVNFIGHLNGCSSAASARWWQSGFSLQRMSTPQHNRKWQLHYHRACISF